MLGWLRRNDGFEWHKYVRTTIKLRREDRRRKLQSAGEALASGAAAAGRASVVAGGSVASRLGSWLQRAIAVLLDGLGRAGAAAGSGLIAGGAMAAKLVAPVWHGLATMPAKVALAILAAGSGVAVHGAWTAGEPLPLPAVVAGSAAVAMLAAPYFAATAAARRLAMVLAGVAAAAGGLLRSHGAMSLRQVRAVLGVVVAIGLVGVGLIAWQRFGRTPFELPQLVLGSDPAVEGRASAVSGDVLRVNDRVLRLEGIEAPERDQRCTRGANRQWRCGLAATEALATRLRGRAISCTLRGTDPAGRTLARCMAGEEDIAERLVRDGHVFATAGILARYASAESEARSKRAGLWNGEADRPAEWRAKRWEEAKRKAPNGCPIKGQVTGQARLYVPPWSPIYERVRVRTERGERWFCSEQDAQAAGFKITDRS